MLTENERGEIINLREFCRPNLPEKRVTDVIISGEYTYIIKELENLGINAVKVFPCSYLPYYERYHADMQCSYYERGKVFLSTDSSVKLEKSSLEIRTEFTKDKTGTEYPYNTLLNHVVMGNFLICREKYTCTEVKNYCISKKIRLIDVKQGYTKCSTAVVNANAVITAESGIYNACIKNAVDALMVEQGDVRLYGYSYGFIGGCCGKISKDILAFTGKLILHRDCDRIKSFLRNYNIYSLELSNKPLTYVGSILPVIQEAE